MAYWPSRSVLRVRVAGHPVCACAAAASRVIVSAKAVRRDGPQLLGSRAKLVSAGFSPSYLPPAPRGSFQPQNSLAGRPCSARGTVWDRWHGVDLRVMRPCNTSSSSDRWRPAIRGTQHRKGC